MGVFSKHRPLPAAPEPAGPDKWLGTEEHGHTVRELKYLDALRDTGLHVESPRAVTFTFTATSARAAQAVASQLQAHTFTVRVSQPDPTKHLWVISADVGPTALVPGLMELSPVLRRIGETPEAVYDGWIALCDDYAKGARAEFRVSTEHLRG